LQPGISTEETPVDGLQTWQDLAGAVSSTVRTVPSGGAYTLTTTFTHDAGMHSAKKTLAREA
jgi:hypothetical protein